MGRWFIRGRCSLMASFRHPLTTSLDRPNPCWQVTQRKRKVFRNYNDKQTDSGQESHNPAISGHPYHFPDYPAQLLIDLIDGRMAYALTSLDKIPSPLRRLSLIDVMQASGTVRLHSHYSLLVSGFLPPEPYLSGFFSPSDRSDPAASIETKYEISGRSVPLSGLLRPATERPH